MVRGYQVLKQSLHPPMGFIYLNAKTKNLECINVSKFNFFFYSGILFSNKILSKTQYIKYLTVDQIWAEGPARGALCLLLTHLPHHSS